VELLHAFLASLEFSFGFRPAAELLDGAVVLGAEPLLQRLRVLLSHLQPNRCREQKKDDDTDQNEVCIHGVSRVRCTPAS
jgi:hypothetical protein